MDALTAALATDGRARKVRAYEMDAREACLYASLDAAIAAIGGERGVCHRGRLVVTAPSGVYVYDAANNNAYASESVVTTFASVAEAEAYARRERIGDALFRAHAAAEREREQMDGPTGHGN